MISDNNVDSVPLNDADEYEHADLIQKAEKMAGTICQPKKIGGKSA